MMPVKITADSTCDIPPWLQDQFDATLIPIHVNLGENSYQDGVDIGPKMIFDYYDKHRALATTSALNLADYYEFFKPYVDKGQQVVHLSLSGEISSCYQNACMAAAELGGVYVVDSRNLSTGSGLLVLRAAEWAAQGMDAAEIARRLEELRGRVVASFLVDTLEYLHKGGRCTAIAALGSNLLKIKPCIEVRGGKMGVQKKYRGKIHNCLLQYVDDRMAQVHQIEKGRIFITGPLANQDTVAAIRQKLEALNHFDEIIFTEAGSAITSHCGPGTIGILYIRAA